MTSSDCSNCLQEYAAAEEAAQEPARVQIIYERALAVFPVTAEVWEKYTTYLEANLKVCYLLFFQEHRLYTS